MPEVTFLDYEVFEDLKARLARQLCDGAADFTEAVLGYGFTEGEGGTPEFTMLCHPTSIESIRHSISHEFSGNAFQVSGVEMKISVHSTNPKGELLHSLTRTAVNPGGDEKDMVESDISEWAQISLGQTLRQVVLNEHRKIILPSYLLRYTPYTSPNLIILRAALSQIHYLRQSGSLHDEFEQRTVSARMSEISRWSSFSRTSIYRLLYEDPHSRWLVDVENKGSFQNDQGQHISQPNEYILQPLQLTPGDAVDLLLYLESHHDEWEGVDECLTALAKLDPRKILAYPYRLPRDGDPDQPATILSVVQQSFSPFELTAERLALLDKVRDNLIGHDFITVPWYVMRNLLPVYGASIITLYMMCQPLLFRQGGVQRDTFWLPGGEETLFAWTNDRSVGKYFPKSDAKGRGRPASENGSDDSSWRKGKRDLLSDFFLRTEVRKDKQGLVQWKIRVNDYPILNQDKRLISGLYEILARLIRDQHIDSLLGVFKQEAFTAPRNQGLSMTDRLYRSALSSSDIKAFSLILKQIISDYETPDKVSISGFETPADRIISIFEPPVQQLISESATPAVELISVFETYLKILFIIKDSIQIHENSNPHPDSGNSSSTEPENRMEDWNFEQILQPVKVEFRKELLQDPHKLDSFMAWLIYGCLNSRVQQPVNLALVKALQENAIPDAAALRLAGQSPIALLSVLTVMQTDPSRANYQQDPLIRAITTDIRQLLMGEHPKDYPILIQRLIDRVCV